MQQGEVNPGSQEKLRPAQSSIAYAEGGDAVSEEPLCSDTVSTERACSDGSGKANVGAQGAATQGLPKRPLSSGSSSRHALRVVAEHDVEWRGPESDELDTSSSQDQSTGSTGSASAGATNGHGGGNGRGSRNRDGASGGMDVTSSSSGILRDSAQHHIVWGTVESVEQRKPNTSKQDTSETDTSSSGTSIAQQKTSPTLAPGPTNYRTQELTVLRKMQQDRGMDPKDVVFQQLAFSEEEADDNEVKDHETDTDRVQDQQELPSVGSAAHISGKCIPCQFIVIQEGCPHGAECAWCHLPHDKRQKTRHCKGKRLRYRRFVQHLENAIAAAPDPDNFDLSTVPIPPSIASDPREMSKLLAKIESIKLQKQAEEADESSPDPAADPACPEDATAKAVDD